MIDIRTCTTGRASYFLDAKCRKSCCIACIVNDDDTVVQEDLDMYGMQMLLQSTIPYDFSR